MKINYGFNTKLVDTEAYFYKFIRHRAKTKKKAKKKKKKI